MRGTKGRGTDGPLRPGALCCLSEGRWGGRGSDNRRTKDGDHCGAPLFGRGRGVRFASCFVFGGFFSSGVRGIFAFSRDFGNAKKITVSSRVSVRASQPGLDGNAAGVMRGLKVTGEWSRSPYKQI